MRRVRAWLLSLSLGVVVCGLIAGSVSWTSSATLLISDEDGRPAGEAFVRYYYAGHLINFVHPVSYIAGGSAIGRSDADGRVTVPSRVHLRRPLPFSTPPTLRIDRVYVPRLHNAFGPIAPMTLPRPGVFRLDEGHEQAFVSDVSTSPERWARSLGDLFDAIRDTVATSGFAPADPRDRDTATHVRVLIDHARREYRAFLERYGDTPRARPDALPGRSVEERKAWEAQVEAQLAREPLWGPYMERTWHNNLEQPDAFEAAVRQGP